MTPPLVCGDSCVLFVCTLSMTGKSTLYKRRGHFILSIGSPLLVIGQALEQAENTIQGISNLSARKKMEYLKYCLAILQYLESENALVE